MPTIACPLFNPVYRNVDGMELRDQGREHIDCFVDELGYVVKRPGLSEVLDLGLGVNRAIDGLFWWPHKSVGIAVSENKVYKITNSGGTLMAANITTNGPGNQSVPVFTVGVNSNVSTPTIYGIIAAGGAMIEGNGTGASISNFTTVADADAPTTVSHVDFIDGYLVATTGKGMFQYSDVNAPLSWAALSFATAMRNPDTIRALKVFRRQIFLFGDVSTEIWENDGTPFAPTPGGYIDTGVLAPNSVVVGEEGIYWLDHKRHFVRFGNGLEQLSTPFDQEIATYSDVEDCVGMRIEVRGRPFLLFQFPTEQKTLAYSVLDKTWSEWRYFDSSVSQYSHFLGRSYCYSPKWGLHLMGSRKESKIYSLSVDNKSDAGEPIRMKVLTGLIDYGTSKRKLCKELRIRAKRGEGVGVGQATLSLRYKDDNRAWSNELQISLGKLGDEETTLRLFPKGVYRTRQYEITVTDNVGVILGDAQEDLELLGS